MVGLTVWKSTTAPSLSGRRGKEGEAFIFGEGGRRPDEAGTEGEANPEARILNRFFQPTKNFL